MARQKVFVKRKISKATVYMIGLFPETCAIQNAKFAGSSKPNKKGNLAHEVVCPSRPQGRAPLHAIIRLKNARTLPLVIFLMSSSE